MRSPVNRLHRQRGQILPLLAVGIFALLGLAALALDVGYWRYQQRMQQSAADSAALAGGIELDYSSQPANVQAQGQAAAATDGFTNGSGGVTVTINNPPLSGSYVGNPTAVEALVTKQSQTFFSSVFGIAPPTITARAVAIDTNNNAYCLYAMNQNLANHAAAGITLNGGGHGGIEAPTCGVLTDSILTVNGTGTVAAQAIGVVDPAASSYANANFTEAQPAQSVVVPDPCPSVPACEAFTNAISAGSSLIPTSPAASPVTSSGTTTYYPGVYTSTLSPSGTAVFSPGVYVLDVPGGNSFDAHGSVSISGIGVTFYNEEGSFYIKGTGSSSISVSAPTSGAFNGLVFYQPQSNSSTVTWDGNDHTVDFAGVSYMPSASLTLNGVAPDVSALVVNDITINGGGITVAGPNLSMPTRGHVVLAE